MEAVVVDRTGEDDVEDKTREGEERRECLPVATTTEEAGSCEDDYTECSCSGQLAAVNNNPIERQLMASLGFESDNRLVVRIGGL
jgi:hypothetical protein